MIGGIDDVKAMAETVEFSPETFDGDPYCAFMHATMEPGSGQAPAGKSVVDDQDRRYAFVNWLLARKPDYLPGTEFSYSNFGYSIIGAVTERLWQKRNGAAHPQGFNGILKEVLMDKFGMQDAGFAPRTNLQETLAMGYEGKAGALTPMPNGLTTSSVEDPAGIIYSTPKKVARLWSAWLQFLQLHPPCFVDPKHLFSTLDKVVDIIAPTSCDGEGARTAATVPGALVNATKRASIAPIPEQIAAPATLKITDSLAMTTQEVCNLAHGAHDDELMEHLKKMHLLKNLNVTNTHLERSVTDNFAAFTSPCKNLKESQQDVYGVENLRLGYAKGWLVEEMTIRPKGKEPYNFMCLSHPGSFDGHIAQFVLLPTFNMGMAMSANYNHKQRWECIHKFVRIAMDCQR